MRRLVWLPPLLAVLALCGGGCSSGDDDDDRAPGAADRIVETITGIVEEMVAGAMARTPEGLQSKVFPHVSDSYDYAGLNKAGYEEKALDDLADNPTLLIDDYALIVEVEPAKDGLTAVARLTNVIEGVLPALASADFDVTLKAEDHGVMRFALEGDGVWRVVAGEAAYSNWRAAGGKESLATALDNVTPNAQSVGPGGQVRATGSLLLPALTPGRQIYASVAFDWQDERANAELWPYAEDSVWSAELTASAGGEYALDVTLPSQGLPPGLTVPQSLPPGADAVELTIAVVVAAGSEILRYDSRTYSLPFRPLENEPTCNAGTGVGVDGIWKATASYQGTPILFELFDLALVGDDIYGAVAYAATSGDGVFFPFAFPVDGVVDGGLLSFGYASDAINVAYEATLSGLEMIDGVLTIDDHLNEPLVLDFSGEKLGNRCEGAGSDTLDGVRLALDVPGAAISSMTCDLDGIAATLDGGGATYYGAQGRNLLVAVDRAQAGPWLAVALDNRNRGYAAFVDGATPAEGTVEVVP